MKRNGFRILLALACLIALGAAVQDFRFAIKSNEVKSASDSRGCCGIGGARRFCRQTPHLEIMMRIIELEPA